jgi:hypothetical protein
MKTVLLQIFTWQRLGVGSTAAASGGWRTMIEFKGSHVEGEVILWGLRWYVAYPISNSQLEEMMQARGVG